jgi:hypothetical protein
VDLEDENTIVTPEQQEIFKTYIAENLEVPEQDQLFERPEIVNFEKYIAIFITSSNWSKVLFLNRENALIKARRQIANSRQKADIEQYKKYCSMSGQQLEHCNTQVMEVLLRHYGITESQFTGSLQDYFVDAERMSQLNMLNQGE